MEQSRKYHFCRTWVTWEALDHFQEALRHWLRQEVVPLQPVAPWSSPRMDAW